MLKFLREDKRYRYIASGILLGITLQDTTSIPVGSITVKEMYLLVGGLPDAVNTYLDTHNIVKVREVQDSIRSLYASDASKYEMEHNKKLLIRRIYEMIPLQMENIRPVLDDICSINLGSVYESVVAQELRAHGHKLFYYDNRKQGEVDYLVDNHQTMSAHPIKVKSGKDYTVHSALNNLFKVPEYNVLTATVISNEREVYQDGKITYMPVYFVMFMEADAPQTDDSEYIF